MGSVYLAHDQNGRKFALKVLKTDSAPLLPLFESEVGILSKLHHPRLVEIEGFSKAGSAFPEMETSPCFWMEYVEGVPLLEAAKTASTDAVLDWLKECLEALEYLHSQGILHGDLKPANILISRNGHVKLVDFGLAALVESSKASRSRRVQGSLPYLAPEVIQGERLPISDLYSLGVIFYQALTGVHPRAQARDLQDLFSPNYKRLKEYSLPIPPRVLRVVERLMEPDRAQRLQSAQDAKAVLLSEGVLEGEAHARGDFFHPFEMLAVEEPRQFFWNFLEEGFEKGQNLGVLIHGFSGVGKTRLIRELSFELALKGYHLISLSPTPGQPLRIHEGEEGSATRTIFTLSHGERLQSAHLPELYRFLKGPADRPCALLLEYSEDSSRENLEGFFAGLKDLENVGDIRLSNLSKDHTQVFLSRALSSELPENFANEIYERTQGNPAMLTEVCRYLVGTGLLEKKLLKTSLLGEFTLPKTFAGLLEKRLARLSEESKRAFSYLALTVGGADSAQLEQLTGLNSQAIRTSLHQFVQLGLVKSSEDVLAESYDLAHAELARIIEKELNEEQKLRHHQHWVRLLESKEKPSDLELFKLAHHVLHLTAHPRRVSWVLQAGEAYTRREQPSFALSLYERCLEHPVTRESKDLLLRTIANTYGRMGRYADATRYSEKWHQEFPEDGTGINPLKYYLATGVNHYSLGNAREARKRFESALKAGKETDAQHQSFLARAHSLLGLLDIEDEDYQQARRHFDAALAMLPESSQGKAEVYKHRALLSVCEDNWEEALRELKRSQDMYVSLDDQVGLFSTWLERGNLALKMGRLPEVETAYGEALAIADAHKDDKSLARVHQNLGVVACRKGDYAAALDELEKAREIFSFLGNPQERATNLLELALAYASVGRFNRAFDCFSSAQNLGKIPSKEHAERTEKVRIQIEILQRGRSSSRSDLFDGKGKPWEWDLERRLLKINLQEETLEAPAAREILETIQQKLPDPLKITFEERADYRRWILGEALNFHFNKEGPNMDILQKLSAINKDLLAAGELEQVLPKILDAAMELSGAERGYLVVKGASQEGPMPGWEIKVARNLSEELMEGQTSEMSLSAVREAMEKGEALVTDNALKDSRFESAESVHQLEIKSILALPLKGTKEVIGALYLDHPFETNKFRGTDLIVLQSFADQAALALQKAQMIAALEAANRQLSQTVEVQETELTALKREVEDQRQKLTYEYKDVVGASPAMLEVLSLVDRITDTSVPVWIYGESGTGKEMIARALHYNSGRAKRVFVSENCSALPETLLESELFGHKKGAFTHADRDKKGLLEHANGGTVFLDEIADMSPTMQAKLLRFLQEGEIRPLGSNQIIKVDVRVVSASNKDLNQLIAEEKFREDLFYRLNGVTVVLPPLRERMEDLPILIQHFLKKFAKDETKDPYEIGADALEILMEYPWPGNVRELENTIRTACLFNQKGKITAKSFNFKKALFGGALPWGKASAFEKGKPKAEGGLAKTTGAKPMTDEKRLLLEALYEHGYHKGHAAEALGISRRYLYTQMMRHGIPANRIEMKAFIQDQLGFR